MADSGASPYGNWCSTARNPHAAAAPKRSRNGRSVKR